MISFLGFAKHLEFFAGRLIEFNSAQLFVRQFENSPDMSGKFGEFRGLLQNEMK